MDNLNSENRIAIRRYHNQLKITSNGVMILGVWSILKIFLVVISGGEFKGVESFERTTFNMVALCIAFFLIFFIDFRFRLVIWRGARQEAYGRKKKKKNKYLVFSVFLLLLSILSLISIINSFINGDYDRSLGFTSLIVELTSFVIMCELIYAGLRIRKIRAEVAANENVKKEEAI